MKKQKLFKTFKCIYVPDCFVVNRFIFLETSPESSGVKSAYDPEVQNLEKLQGELPPAINVEITQAIKDFKDAKRLVETYTKQLKDLQSGHDDYATKARIRTTKQYLEDSKNKLQDAEKKLDEVIDKHSESIKVAETAAKLMRKEERRLKIAELYKAEEAARLAAIPLPTAASGAAAATGEPTAKPTATPKAASAQAPASPAAPEPAPAAAPAAASGAKKSPEKPADWTPERKFQRMMDRYVGDGDNFLISKEDFAKALNYAKGVSTVFTATDVSEIKNAATIVESVKLLQKKLNSEKSAGLEVDGIFGKKTFAAYKSTETAPAAAAPTEPRPAEEPEKQPPAPPVVTPETNAPAPAPETPSEQPKLLIETFEDSKFYQIKDNIRDLTEEQRNELTEFATVYLLNVNEKDDMLTVLKAGSDTPLKIHKNYVKQLGSKDWGVKEKNAFKADYYNRLLGQEKIDREKVYWVKSTDKHVQLTDQAVGVGAKNVLDNAGAPLIVDSNDLVKETDPEKIDQYVIDVYETTRALAQSAPPYLTQSTS